MSSIFINRNRTQGVYGKQKEQSHPLKITPLQATGEIWKARAQVPEENQFYKTSLKYSSNLDFKPERIPGTSWALIDSCDAVRNQQKSAIFQSENLAGEWKQFNNFEQKDAKFKKKEILKDEIQNIAMRIVRAREAQMNMTY